VTIAVINDAVEQEERGRETMKEKRGTDVVVKVLRPRKILVVLAFAPLQ
jgi:hypothetical protein